MKCGYLAVFSTYGTIQLRYRFLYKIALGLITQQIMASTGLFWLMAVDLKRPIQPDDFYLKIELPKPQQQRKRSKSKFLQIQGTNLIDPQMPSNLGLRLG